MHPLWVEMHEVYFGKIHVIDVQVKFASDFINKKMYQPKLRIQLSKPEALVCATKKILTDIILVCFYYYH